MRSKTISQCRPELRSGVIINEHLQIEGCVPYRTSSLEIVESCGLGRLSRGQGELLCVVRMIQRRTQLWLSCRWRIIEFVRCTVNRHKCHKRRSAQPISMSIEMLMVEELPKSDRSSHSIDGTDGFYPVDLVETCAERCAQEKSNLTQGITIAWRCAALATQLEASAYSCCVARWHGMAVQFTGRRVFSSQDSRAGRSYGLIAGSRS